MLINNDASDYSVHNEHVAGRAHAVVSTAAWQHRDAEQFVSQKCRHIEASWSARRSPTGYYPAWVADHADSGRFDVAMMRRAQSA